jgi:aspartyl-tRNA synthetase
MRRSHTCGELTASNIGNEVILEGWVDTFRDHGNITFVDLRDRYGLTQLVIDHSKSKEIAETIKNIRKEFVIHVEGKVQKRPAGTEKKDLPTGEIEIDTNKIFVVGPALPLPIDLSGRTETNEDMGLKYRYLALRDLKLQKNLMARHKIVKAFRDFYDSEGFVDIETPIMAKSTPEGSRDYLVPSRINPGKFYALPQSPQLFKQLLMLSGFDKYYQVARCFRDEDLRADRQPEFTQIDWEMSFVNRDDLLDVGERALQKVMKDVLDVDIQVPIKRIAHSESMKTYGVDKPDTRFGLTLIDITSILCKGTFNAFNDVVKNGGIINAINIEGKADFSRKDISELEDLAKIHGAKGLAYLKFVKGAFEGSIAKFFSPEVLSELKQKTNAKENDLIIIVADKSKNVYPALGAIRNSLGKKLNLIKPNTWDFVWVVDFPLLEKDEDTGGLTYAHNPFSMPKEEQLHLLNSEPLKVLSGSFDMVLNGYELGSGCIRITRPELQRKIFNMIGLSDKEIDSRFSFILDAYKYGAPVHGGFAFGLDRLAMLLVGSANMREVLAFPKNKSGISLMDDAPSTVSEKQLKELHIVVDLPKEEKENKQ